ncbi:MAG: universal stress protein, partial [Chitinophagaceae bacterium]|nr:universal stress protein [Chitinophagaceae bacterium]
LIPIDFSETSKNALLYAGEIAKRASGKLLILNVLQNGNNKEQVSNSLEETAKELKQTLDTDIDFTCLVGEHDLVNAIMSNHDTSGIDLIVMGTNGATGLKKIFIGSNTVKVIGKIKIPVMVIPGTARYEDYVNTGKNRIVLATDLEELGEDCTLDILKEIGILFHAPQLVVLNVRPENTRLPLYKRIERDFIQSLFRPEIDTTRATVFSSNIINGIKLYLDKKTDTGLVAMVAKETGAFLEKHYTKEMASHANLPLLVLHDKGK